MTHNRRAPLGLHDNLPGHSLAQETHLQNVQIELQLLLAARIGRFGHLLCRKAAGQLQQLVPPQATAAGACSTDPITSAPSRHTAHAWCKYAGVVTGWGRAGLQDEACDCPPQAALCLRPPNAVQLHCHLLLLCEVKVPAHASRSCHHSIAAMLAYWLAAEFGYTYEPWDRTRRER